MNFYHGHVESSHLVEQLFVFFYWMEKRLSEFQYYPWLLPKYITNFILSCLKEQMDLSWSQKYCTHAIFRSVVGKVMQMSRVGVVDIGLHLNYFELIRDRLLRNVARKERPCVEAETIFLCLASFLNCLKLMIDFLNLLLELSFTLREPRTLGITWDRIFPKGFHRISASFFMPWILVMGKSWLIVHQF